MSTDNFEKGTFNPFNLSLEERIKELKSLMKRDMGINLPYDLAKKNILEQDMHSVYLNDTYQVIVYENDEDIFDDDLKKDMIYLSIKRLDKKSIRSWEDLYEIKNALVPDGKQRWAVELFPPSHHLVNTSNQYHLWVYPKGYYPPFGFIHKGNRITSFLAKLYMKLFWKADIK